MTEAKKKKIGGKSGAVKGHILLVWMMFGEQTLKTGFSSWANEVRSYSRDHSPQKKSN